MALPCLFTQHACHNAVQIAKNAENSIKFYFCRLRQRFGGAGQSTKSVCLLLAGTGPSVSTVLQRQGRQLSALGTNCNLLCKSQVSIGGFLIVALCVHVCVCV